MRKSGKAPGVPGVLEIACAQLICHCLGFLECFHPRKFFLGLKTELLRTCPRIGPSGTVSLSPHQPWPALPCAGFCAACGTESTEPRACSPRAPGPVAKPGEGWEASGAWRVLPGPVAGLDTDRERAAVREKKAAGAGKEPTSWVSQ